MYIGQPASARTHTQTHREEKPQSLKQKTAFPNRLSNLRQSIDCH